MAQGEIATQSREGTNYIKRVAIVGAGGDCGKYIAEALLDTGRHVVTAITRAESNAKLPDGVQVKKDALLITMGVTAPADQENKLIEAAAEANVPWILPNEWGTDTTDESLCNDILIGEAKRKSRDLIKKLGKCSYIAVSTGFWYEWSLAIPLAYGIDFANRTAILYDDGKTRISTSTWPQVGRGVAKLLSLKVHSDGEEDHSPCLDQFKNGPLYFSSFTVSQKDMLESALRVTKTSLEDWKERVWKAALREGFLPGWRWNLEAKGLHNDVLGLPKEDLDAYTRLAIKRSEETPPW
ncbi:hypothetical protein BDV97DRAFT_377728 [Delphinella strobiligena]|nr:hypothetical protein BDV97DRAFT_377728 [Delphinella strobiligena]